MSLKTKVMPGVKRAMSVLRRSSPEIQVVAGIVVGIAGAVVAARAYKKHEEILDEVSDEITLVREHYDRKGADVSVKVRELSPLYGEYTARFVGLYGPPVAMGALSILLILRGVKILRGRNEALLAAASVLERGFKSYRERVIAEHGEEADERYRLSADRKKVTISETDENGKVTKTRKTVNVIPEDFDGSMYAVIFDEANKNWSQDRGTNYNFLKIAEKYFNDNLDNLGYITLNDVWKYLRIPTTPEGQIVGWHMDAPGDNWVDFGLNRPINRQQGENRFIIDPNVNGVIYEYIGG